MAKYEVIDNETGITFEIEGDREPTEVEVTQLMASPEFLQYKKSEGLVPGTGKDVLTAVGKSMIPRPDLAIPAAYKASQGATTPGVDKWLLGPLAAAGAGLGQVFQPIAGPLAIADRGVRASGQVLNAEARGHKLTPQEKRKLGQYALTGESNELVSDYKAPDTSSALVNTVTGLGTDVANNPLATVGTAVAGAAIPLPGAKTVAEKVAPGEAANKLLTQSLKPGQKAGRLQANDLTQFNNDLKSAVPAIVESGLKVKTFEDLGNAAQKVMDNNRQNVYEPALKAAGDVDLNVVADSIRNLSKDPSLKLYDPAAIDYINEVANRFSERGKVSALEADQILQGGNKRGTSFYEASSSAQRSKLANENTAIVIEANKILRQLIDQQLDAVGADGTALRQQYGALKRIKKLAEDRGIKEAKDPTFLEKTLDPFAYSLIAGGLGYQKPAVALAGGTLLAAKATASKLRSPEFKLTRGLKAAAAEPARGVSLLNRSTGLSAGLGANR